MGLEQRIHFIADHPYFFVVWVWNDAESRNFCKDYIFHKLDYPDQLSVYCAILAQLEKEHTSDRRREDHRRYSEGGRRH